jgi:hypothetical protein
MSPIVFPGLFRGYLRFAQRTVGSPVPPPRRETPRAAATARLRRALLPVPAVCADPCTWQTFYAGSRFNAAIQ